MLFASLSLDVEDISVGRTFNVPESLVLRFVSLFTFLALGLSFTDLVSMFFISFSGRDGADFSSKIFKRWSTPPERSNKGSLVFFFFFGVEGIALDAVVVVLKSTKACESADEDG